MDYVGNLISSLNSFYNEINPATLSGAIDIIVIEQQDGDLASSPFHVRFGKLSVLLPQEKKVEIQVNGKDVPYLMKVGEAGEAFFVFETSHEVPEEFQTSPILQALTDNHNHRIKIDVNEDPPFLDITDNKSDEKDTRVKKKKTDNFEDEDTTTIRIPAELQSPKMIIEEQMDKVVTKGGPYHNKDFQEETNNVTSSILVEHETRVNKEAITTTTIAKERFIVRPLEGNINSKWMDVTHTIGEDVAVTVTTSEKTFDKAITEVIHAENESIMLDISGYKTQQEGKDNSRSLEDDKLATNSSAITAETPADTDTVDSKTADEAAVASAWGWGQSYAQGEEEKDKEHTDSNLSPSPTADTDIKEQDNDIVQLKAGHTFCIEMSLCGFAAFGHDKDENAQLFQEKQVSYDNFVHTPSMLNDPRLVFRYNRQYFAAASNSNPLFTSLLIFKQEEVEAIKKVQDCRDTYSYGCGWRQWLSRSSADGGLEEKVEEGTTEDQTQGEKTTFTSTTKTTSVGWSSLDNKNTTATTENMTTTHPRKLYAKTLRLTSDQLKSLNLKKGVNTISFSVKSAYQGVATCVAKIFFWDYDTVVVISDIDGTITKSDTMGHLMTMIGKDWTHEGVAQLYTDIANNGYHFMYLTSRAIGQADYTRDYLKKVLQGNYNLPDGPMIMSPDRLFTSLHREIIMRKPEMFKMACLKDIQQLFGGRDPFYAGFGNRITDAISYRSVNVPSQRIFTIDPQGDVKWVTSQSTYLALNELVDQIFPPKTINEEFTDYNFWKTPLIEIDIPEEEEESMPLRKPKPIVSDPNSLPKESIVGYVPEPKRGLLSGFRSSSSFSTKSSPPPPPPPPPPPLVRSSTTSPALLPKTPLIISASSTLILNDVEVTGSSKASSILSSPRSLPVDNNSSGTSTPTMKQKYSSSSIISKVMGGVFFRSTSVSSPPLKTMDIAALDNNIKEEKEENVLSSPQGQDDNDDDLINQEIDNLDLSKIPFL